MRSAIKDLMQFSDSRLFEEVSEGISQIVGECGELGGCG